MIARRRLRLAREAFLSQLGDCPFRDPLELALDQRRIDLRRAERLRPHLVDADVGEQQAERGEDPGVGRNDHLRDAERAGERGGVQAAGTAEGEQREAAGVVAALEGDHLDRAGHVLVGDLDDRRGQLHRLHAETRRKPIDRLDREARVESHAPAEEVLGVEATEQEVRVRHRHLAAAAAVADRAGLRPGAARADAKEAACVHPGDRAAAGADRLHVDERHRRRQPPLDLELGRVALLAAGDDAHVGARAAHVEREHVLLAQRSGEALARDHAAGRARHHGLDRRLRGRLGEHRASVRLHDRPRARHAASGGARRPGSRRSRRTAASGRRRRSSSRPARTRARSGRPRARRRAGSRRAPRAGAAPPAPRARC